jgi:hypothetical protein
VSVHLFLTPALDRGDCSSSCSGGLYPRGHSPRNPWSVGLNGSEKRYGCFREARNLSTMSRSEISLDRPACTLSFISEIYRAQVSKRIHSNKSVLTHKPNLSTVVMLQSMLVVTNGITRWQQYMGVTGTYSAVGIAV